MAKTIYAKIDNLRLDGPMEMQLDQGVKVSTYGSKDDLSGIIVEGLSLDDIAVGSPVSLTVTYGGNTIKKRLTCVYVTENSADGSRVAAFADGTPAEGVNAFGVMLSLNASQASVSVNEVGVRKELAESVFGDPSSDNDGLYYDPVSIVISSPEEDSDSKGNNNMKVLKITDNYKMSKILRMTDGYYMVAQNPILLHEKDSEDVEEIPVGAIVCIRSEDSPFYPMKTITNCDNDVTYYITSIFQNRDVIEYSKKDTATDSIKIDQLDDRSAKKVVLCHIEPPFEEGEEEERTEAYKAIKNFIESEANDFRMRRPYWIPRGPGLPMTNVVNYLWQLNNNWEQLSSSEKAAYLVFCENMVPQYGVMLEMTDGRKFDIPPVRYRSEKISSYGSRGQNPYAVVEFINEVESETVFDGGAGILLDDGTDVTFDFAHRCVLDGDKWKINELVMNAQLGDRIKSVDIYVIQ